MTRTTTARGRRSLSHRRLLQTPDDDPLGGVANLFDVAMVFAVALLLALVARFHLPELLSDQDFAILKNPQSPQMEIIRRDHKKLEHYRVTRQQLAGQGERLGAAYRLKSGEVVYVPE